MSHLSAQRERVKAQLREDRAAGHGTCGNALLALHIPRYGARIWEMRHEDGFVIVTHSRCRRHEHQGAVHEFELTYDPDVARSALSSTRPAAGTPQGGSSRTLGGSAVRADAPTTGEEAEPVPVHIPPDSDAHHALPAVRAHQHEQMPLVGIS